VRDELGATPRGLYSMHEPESKFITICIVNKDMLEHFVTEFARLGSGVDNKFIWGICNEKVEKITKLKAYLT